MLFRSVSFKVSGNPMGGTNTVTSAPVTLLFGVVPYSLPAAPAILSAPRWDGTRFTCRVTGSPGRDYQIETSADLRTWTAAASVKTDGAGNGDVDASAQDGARFFRAMALP